MKILVAAERPALVVSDWHMPVLNGIDALAELRASGSTVPFGFVTSDGSDAVRRRASVAPGGTHLRLHELHPAGDDLPCGARSQSLTLGRRSDVELDIEGYGAGRPSVVLVERPSPGADGSHPA